MAPPTESHWSHPLLSNIWWETVNPSASDLDLEKSALISLFMISPLDRGGSSLGRDGLCGWRIDCASWTQGRWRLCWQAKESILNNLWSLCGSLYILRTARSSLFSQCSTKGPRALCHGQGLLRQSSLPSPFGYKTPLMIAHHVLALDSQVFATFCLDHRILMTLQRVQLIQLPAAMWTTLSTSDLSSAAYPMLAPHRTQQNSWSCSLSS